MTKHQDLADDEAETVTDGGLDPESVPTTDEAEAVVSDPDRAAPPGDAARDEDVSVEDLVSTLEVVSTERDQYLDTLRRVQAEFENYKKAVAKRTADERDRANDRIVHELLPVLDACDNALASGIDQLDPIRSQLIAALERHGLERSDPIDQPFDPEHHEAVMHEPADDVDEPTVVEVLRSGYRWKGRVLRPAMVRVKG